ncbi:MAG: hypothetical protein C4576_24460 [Desulfobacteraceae bacterium]|nr:MAG: hypothetical protein C4576_24460 [Desulfobacteraceae bacterium]
MMKRDAPYEILDCVKLPRILSRIFFKQSVTILMYHGITPEKLPIEDWCFTESAIFQEHLKYLRNHFYLTSLSGAVDLLMSGRIKEPTAVITFDDGFASTYDLVFPLLKETGVPVAIFLSTKFIDSDDTIWFCRLHQALTATVAPEFVWRGERLRIDGKARKAAVSNLLQAALKELPRDQLDAEVHEIARMLSQRAKPVGEKSPFRILSAGQISQMQQSGLVEFGAHSHSHAILSRLSSEEQEKEIMLSKENVERLTKRPCRYFSYPNGRRQDYDITTIHLLRSAGFIAALTTVSGPNDKHSPLMELNRYDAGGNVHQAAFSATVHHFRWTGNRITGRLSPRNRRSAIRIGVTK